MSPPLRILVATDAWRPQINGVVRTYERLADEVRAFGAELIFLTPEGQPGLPLPSYPEIQLALIGRRTVEALAGAVDRSMAAIEPYLAQIRLTSWPQDA